MTTLNEAGVTVPCLTDCEMRKKSYHSGFVTAVSTMVPGGGFDSCGPPENTIQFAGESSYCYTSYLLP